MDGIWIQRGAGQGGLIVPVIGFVIVVIIVIIGGYGCAYFCFGFVLFGLKWLFREG